MAFSLLTQTPFSLSLTSTATPRNAVSAAAGPSASISTSQRKPRRKKQQNDLKSSDDNGYPGSEGGNFAPSSAEKLLRLVFMEELMERARSGSAAGVSDVIYDMIAAGLTPGPRSFHGLVVSHVLNRDEEGSMHALRRQLSEGLRPLHETFLALVRLFGSKGRATRGLEILAAMEKLNYDIRQAWLLLVEELVKCKHLEDANRVFLKGAEGGLRATDKLYDLLIEEDCKVGDHSNALTIAYEMEAAGRMATTFHFNCLLSVQATCGIPEIAFATFENMEYGEEGFLQADRRDDMESVGEKFINVLLHNSLLQVSERDDYGNVKSCGMHDLVHDLACSVSSSSNSTGGSSRIRYMVLRSPIPKEMAKYLRTLLMSIYGGSSGINFSDFESLHVLRLDHGVEELSSSIRKLIHLRYFDISQTRTKYFSDWIGEFFHLQTLRADLQDWHIRIERKLPSTIKYLINLRHLYISENVELPMGIGRLTSLQTLKYFPVGDENGCKIEELGSLNNLKGELQIRNLERGE